MEYQLNKEKLRRSMNNLKLTEKKDITGLLNKLRHQQFFQKVLLTKLAS